MKSLNIDNLFLKVPQNFSPFGVLSLLSDQRKLSGLNKLPKINKMQKNTVYLWEVSLQRSTLLMTSKLLKNSTSMLKHIGLGLCDSQMASTNGLTTNLFISQTGVKTK
jgi:hypothetical protein